MAFAITPALTLAQPAYQDEIIVTGTRIPRKDNSAASPVSTFDREALAAFGSVATEEFLNAQPQLSPDLGKTSNAPGDGTAAVNLRGLGRGRTLVLLNGRRLAPTGVTSAVDINAIPSSLIERIEVVTGGASAVYGSDAVTGAVNFITRKRFEGVEAAGQFDIYGAGDGETYDASIAAGTDFAEDRGHVSVFADYYRRTSVLQGDRARTRVTLLDVDGVLQPAGSLNVPGSATLEPDIADSLFFNSDGTVRAFEIPGDLYNFAPLNYLQTPLERWSAGVFAEIEPTPDFKLFAELLFANPHAGQQAAPALGDFFADFSLSSAFFAPSAIGVLSARYDADGDGLASALVSTRFEGVGERTVRSARDYYRGLIGARAELSARWSIDAFYSYARNEAVQTLGGAVSLNRVLQGLILDPAGAGCLDQSNGCVPVNLFGAGNLSAPAREFITLRTIANGYRSVQHNAAIVATGSLLDAPAGEVAASVGAEFRRNEAAATPDPIFDSGDVLGFDGFAGARGSVNVHELFGELFLPLARNAPLVRQLEMELGARYSDYSNSGGAWTWKLGGQWLPLSGLRFSGSWQRAVRAPNVEELFAEEVRTLGFIPFVVDFCRASADPVGAGLADVCIAQGLDPALIGIYDPPSQAGAFADLVAVGNPKLGVERAATVTVGFDYSFDSPANLVIGVDYFSIDLKDAITTIDRPLVRCKAGGDPMSEACLAVRRAPSGVPIEIILQPTNVASVIARGLDFRVDFSADLPRSFGLGGDARFALASDATYYFKNGERQTAEAQFIDCAGYFFSTCANESGGGASAAVAVPEAQVTNVFSLKKDRFDFSLRWRWLSGVDNYGPVLERLAGLPPAPIAVPAIGDRHYLDFAAGAVLADRVRVRFGVDNLGATKAPLLGVEQSQANTDPSRYDVFGRRFYVRLEAKLGGAE